MKLQEHDSPEPNLSPPARDYLASLGLASDDEAIWMHCLSVCHSSEYLERNGAGVRQDWPRIPLPAWADVLLGSAELGRRVADLLDIESPADRITKGDIAAELRPLGSIARADDGQVNPPAGDLTVTVGWGHAGQGGVTMPGRGRLIERPCTTVELAGFQEGLAGLRTTHEQVLTCLGDACCDIYLNDATFWRCVPKRVWTYTIGGYR